jgi:hypothetical protein
MIHVELSEDEGHVLLALLGRMVCTDEYTGIYQRLRLALEVDKPKYLGQCGVCATEYQSDIQYPAGCFCPVCRERKLIAPGVVNFVEREKYVPLPESEFPKS